MCVRVLPVALPVWVPNESSLCVRRMSIFRYIYIPQIGSELSIHATLTQKPAAAQADNKTKRSSDRFVTLGLRRVQSKASVRHNTGIKRM